MGEYLIVPPISSLDVPSTQWPGVRYCEDALKPLDLGNDSFNFHSHQYSYTGKSTPDHAAALKSLMMLLPAFRLQQI